MRTIHINTVDHVRRSVIAIGNSYPDGHFIPTHFHRRGQLISSATGVIVLSSAKGTWIMPPQRGLWIPPSVQHEVRMVGDVEMQSLYIEPSAVPDMPAHCQVVGISPFMRALIIEALDVALTYPEGSRGDALMRLVQHELRELTVVPLSLPYPTDPVLAKRCRAFVQAPSITETINHWSDALRMSRRAFTQFFRQETGLTFVAWRQQACLMVALPRLSAGESVTIVALDLGYESSGAFSTMFKRTFGTSPLAYLKQH